MKGVRRFWRFRVLRRLSAATILATILFTFSCSPHTQKSRAEHSPATHAHPPAAAPKESRPPTPRIAGSAQSRTSETTAPVGTSDTTAVFFTATAKTCHACDGHGKQTCSHCGGRDLTKVEFGTF